MTDIHTTITVSGADLKRHYPVSRAIDALIDLVAKIAWFEQGYAEGFAAGQEAMRAECDRVALAHKSKTENGRAWYEGRDWAVIRISNAIRALPIDPPCKPEEEK